MGSGSLTGIGLVELAKCLRHLRDGHKGIALAHIRRALKTEPHNPFFLSYVGMLSAVAEKRYLAGEKLCREPLENKVEPPATLFKSRRGISPSRT